VCVCVCVCVCAQTRFANNQDIYKNFLEILHTYQKEQRSINEVPPCGSDSGSGSGGMCV
jgi:hypothetical protein